MKPLHIINHSCDRIGRCVKICLIISFFTGLLFLGCFWPSQDCSAQNSDDFDYDDEFIKSFETLLKQYALEDEDAKLECLWDEYLKSHTHFDNHEYQKTCRQLGNKYAQSITKLGRCSEEMLEHGKEYSSEWLDDLIEQFGRPYVLENMGLIRLHLNYLYNRRAQNACEEFEKEAIYREYAYKAAFNKYFSLYLDFFEDLDQEQKIQLNNRKAVAEELMGVLNKASITDIVSDGALRENLLAIAVKDRPGSNAKLTEFFLNHPFFSKPFDPMKCVKDLKKLDNQ
jgi:hypothetical protein